MQRLDRIYTGIFPWYSNDLVTEVEMVGQVYTIVSLNDDEYDPEAHLAVEKAIWLPEAKILLKFLGSGHISVDGWYASFPPPNTSGIAYRLLGTTEVPSTVMKSLKIFFKTQNKVSALREKALSIDGEADVLERHNYERLMDIRKDISAIKR